MSTDTRPDSVGQFLPWHRYFVRAHELALQTLCGYKGGHPYWDELTDIVNGPVQAMHIFDHVTSFGGNGTGPNSCVEDGPFKDTVLHMSNHHARGDEFCLSRAYNQTWMDAARASNIEQCFGYPTYANAWQCFSAMPHGAGHGGVGGLMTDPIDGANDPLFHLHHAYLDKLWWEWQKANYTERLTDMSGNNTAPEFTLILSGLSQPGPEIMDYNGDPGTVTTLNYNLWMNSLLANVTVGDVMQLNGSTICAEYIVDPNAVRYNMSVYTEGDHSF